MSTPRRTIRDARELRALTHPIRIELLERLLTDGPLTATGAAALIGQSHASCSFHLRQLAQYGFVEPAAGGRGRERPWQLVGRGLTWESAGAPPDDRGEFAAAGAEVSALLLERATAAATTWMAHRDGEAEPWTTLGEITAAVRNLTADQLRELVAGVRAALEPFLAVGDAEPATPSARRVRMAFVAVPDDRRE